MRIVLLFICCAQMAFAQLDKGLVAHWPMDGNTKDASGNGYEATLVGTITLSEDRSGHFGCGLKFSMDSLSYLDVSKPLVLDTAQDVTISYWTKNVPVNNTKSKDLRGEYVKQLFGVGNKSGAFRNITGIFESSYFSSMDLSLSNCTTIVNHQEYISNQPYTYSKYAGWQHVTIVINGTMTSNGHLSTTFINNTTNYDSEGYVIYKKLGYPFKMLQIGRANAEIFDPYKRQNMPKDSASLEHILDDIRIYNRSLSQSELQMLQTLPSNCTITALKPTTIDTTDTKVMLHAYDLTGREIPDYTVYTGAAILLYSDGTRSKIVK